MELKQLLDDLFPAGHRIQNQGGALFGQRAGGGS